LINNLVVKYAVIGAVMVPAGIFIASLFGMNLEMGYVAGVIAGAVGGAIGGWLRHRAGKTD